MKINDSNLPGVPESEQKLLYEKLNKYNSGRASFKEAGAYIVVPPRPSHTNCSLWVFSPKLERQSILFIRDLDPNIIDAIRTASSLFYSSNRCLVILDYNDKRMHSNGEDVMPFGKYRGHYLHEILSIAPSYISWLAGTFEPKIPKQERFLEMLKTYASVQDDLIKHRLNRNSAGHFLGKVDEKLTNLTLRVVHVKVEDNPYKTHVLNGVPQFYTQQYLILEDTDGDKVVILFNSSQPSTQSETLPPMDHAFSIGEILQIESARVAKTYESRGVKFTRLNYVKLKK